MTLRTDLLPIIDDLRELCGPNGFDVVTASVKIRKRVWSGGRAGSGTTTDTDTNLDTFYKVRGVSAREVSESAGRYSLEDIKVGPITPSYAGGGWTAAALVPTGAQGTEIIYVLSGQISGEYTLVQLHTEEPFSYYMILRRRRTTP